MKRLIIVALLPMLLPALEPVNLVKNGSFEKENGFWNQRSVKTQPLPYDSTEFDSQETDSVSIGNYCCSIDGRVRPWPELPDFYGVNGIFYQILTRPKELNDIDSLMTQHMSMFSEEGNKSSAGNYAIGLDFKDPNDGNLIEVWYVFSKSL